MPTVNLTLDSTQVAAGGRAYAYCTSRVTATLPSVLRNAVISAVRFTYTITADRSPITTFFSEIHVAWGGGFYDGQVNDATLLEKLQSLDRPVSFDMLFCVKTGVAAGTVYWRDIQIEVEYMPASDVAGTIDIGDSAVFYSVNKRSVALGETVDILLDVHPETEISDVSLELGDTDHVVYATASSAVRCAAGSTTTVTLTMLLAGTLTTRTKNGYVRVTLGTTDGDVSSQWTLCGEEHTLKLVRERAAPVVSMTWEDAEELIDTYGYMVQSKSRPRVSVSATLDTAADSAITITSRELTMADSVRTQTYRSGSNTFEIAQLVNGGTVTCTLTVTDSYGQVGTAETTLTVLEYLAPSVDELAFVRYATHVTPDSGTEYVPDDGSELIWVDCAANVSALNGHNAWTMVAAYKQAGSTGAALTVTMLTGTDGIRITRSADRTMFTPHLLETAAWTVTVTLADQFGSAVKTVDIDKADAIFDIEEGGVAVGKRSEGTAAKPLFEVAYETHFGDDVYDKNGNPLGMTAYSTTPKPCGTWIDGRTIYRVVLTGLSMPSGTSYLDLDFSVDTPINMYGMFKHNNEWHPVNSYYSGSYRAYVRYSTASRLIMVGGNNYTDGFIVLEYIPAAT